MDGSSGFDDNLDKDMHKWLVLNICAFIELKFCQVLKTIPVGKTLCDTEIAQATLSDMNSGEKLGECYS